jgi:hypothetical protein
MRRCTASPSPSWGSIPAQAYLTRLQAAGKSKREALRVLKRRLVRVVFNLLQADLHQARLD